MEKHERRFLSKIIEEGECLVWTGSTDGRYGQFYWQGRMWKAHRAAWFMTNGDIPEGLGVLHKCDNTKCVRVSHLFLGTQSENLKDCIAKGRHWTQLYPERIRRGADSFPCLHPERLARGERHGIAKLTEKDVRAIRKLKLPSRKIASLYKVGQTTVLEILNGKRWIHVK